MIPYRYYSLLTGGMFALAGLWSSGAGILGLVGVVDANLLVFPVGAGFGALGVAVIKDFIEKEERAEARAARRRRRPPGRQ